MRSTIVRGVCTALAAVSFTVIAVGSVAGCSRGAIDAVNLANEADKAKDSNLDEAISKYEQATQLDPTNHRILWKLAKAYHKKEDWSDDALTCSKAEKVAPTYANYYFEHGYALEQQAVKGPTQWSEAKGPLEQAIKLDPGFADAYDDLANVLYHTDDEQGALQNYTKAIETRPDQLPFYAALAELYFDLGYLDQAEQVLREAVNFQAEGANATPEGAPKAHAALFNVHTLLGGIYESKGNVSSEISEYEAAKKECGQCNERGQQIAYFDLGVAYSHATPAPQERGAPTSPAISEDRLPRGGGPEVRRRVLDGAGRSPAFGRHPAVDALVASTEPLRSRLEALLDRSRERRDRLGLSRESSVAPVDSATPVGGVPRGREGPSHRAVALIPLAFEKSITVFSAASPSASASRRIRSPNPSGVAVARSP